MKQISAYTRPRPVIELAGTPFYVDAEWLYLIEVGNQENKIDMHEARYIDGCLELWYDAATKNIYSGDIEASSGNVHVFSFHSFSALDPIGAAALLDDLNPEWRKEQKSNLPIVNFAGKRFFVDKKNKCFYEVNNCWNSIAFHAVTLRKKVMGIYLNLHTFNIPFESDLCLPNSSSPLPDHLVFVPIAEGTKARKIIDHFLRSKKTSRKPLAD